MPKVQVEDVSGMWLHQLRDPALCLIIVILRVHVFAPLAPLPCEPTLSVYLVFVLLVTQLSSQTSQVLSYLDNRRKVHKDAINFCQDILRRKYVDWEAASRSNLSQPIRDVDLVITVGGDGTLLQASHFMDDSISVLGVNSDPTQAEEVSCLSISILDLVTNMCWPVGYTLINSFWF